MATINYTRTQVLGDTGLGDTGSYIAGWLYTWGPMANGDVGQPATTVRGFVDRSVQAEGTFGSGGSVAAEGSNDGTNFRALTNPQGTTIAITSGGIQQVTEAVAQFRPHVTAGDGTTALTVTAFFRNAQQRP